MVSKPFSVRTRSASAAPLTTAFPPSSSSSLGGVENMEDQYGMADLRHYINGRPLFPQIQSPPDLLSAHRAAHPYDMLIFTSDSAAAAANNNAAANSNAFESGGAGRWPRQETLNLLEIRSRLDPKFKEANQKGPLWDEVSRIMCEEHGYQRSSKKCREKFENLYKYYKKTKEGKAGRQDGKHYRFFRQLEALYGTTEANISSVSISEAAHHTSGPTPKASDTSLSLSNYSDADTSSSDDSDDTKKSGWKVKIRDFIDAQMKRLMEKQEAWMEKMVRMIEEKERERAAREEEWRKHDAARIEREHRFWAGERAWIEARDAALMNALHKLTGKESHWTECEISKLIQLATEMEGRFDEEMVWEEIAAKMGCFGHERSAAACKEKWESIHNYVNKKRRDSNSNYQSNVYCEQGLNNDHGSSSSAATGISESCFRYFMGDAY
ncbi:trihelix transcription factor PTL-like [Salvia splendens]|uniref:trihelix transcription factor PTL-like n=1 Tax=Salvia splendens TaxID=180675 RepID=UPI001C25E697|nr:trihelix transcription factor PTL-like [Salvia splendens]